MVVLVGGVVVAGAAEVEDGVPLVLVVGDFDVAELFGSDADGIARADPATGNTDRVR
ncbi:MAG TPA: hypothetical protein VG368_02135 [Acidimicrobiales bacterium]|nr:hypothetical protein [Acidimicrobiales bacterium]